MSFLTHEENGLVWLTSPLLSGVRHGFSTRQGGVSQPPFDTMNLAPGRGDDPSAVQENYRRFCGALGMAPARTVLSKQVHEATVRLCTAGDAGKGLLSPRDYAADALITREAELPLVVFSADCGIILLYDPAEQFWDILKVIVKMLPDHAAGLHDLCDGDFVQRLLRHQRFQSGADLSLGSLACLVCPFPHPDNHEPFLQLSILF